jgi:hypothetical protein
MNTTTRTSGRPSASSMFEDEDDDRLYQNPRMVISARRPPAEGYQAARTAAPSSGAQTLRTNAPKNHARRRTDEYRHIADVAKDDGYDVEVQTGRLPDDISYHRTRASQSARITQAVPTTKMPPRRQMMQDPVTQPARSVRRAKWWNRLHPATKIGVVACTLFLAMELALNSATLVISSWSDPITYFHRDRAIVSIDGHRELVRAFMSLDGQVDLQVVPEDASTSKVIVGAQSMGMDPTRVMFAVEVHGSRVVVETLAPREMVAHLYPKQDVLSPCVFDLSQKGGK